MQSGGNNDKMAKTDRGSDDAGGFASAKPTTPSSVRSLSLYGKKKVLSVSDYQEHLESVNSAAYIDSGSSRQRKEGVRLIEFDEEVVGKIDWKEGLDNLSDEEEEARIHRDDGICALGQVGGRKSKRDENAAERVAKGRPAPVSKKDLDKYRHHARQRVWQPSWEEEQKMRRDMNEVRLMREVRATHDKCKEKSRFNEREERKSEDEGCEKTEEGPSVLYF